MFEKARELTGYEVNELREECKAARGIGGSEETDYWQQICAVCDRVQIGSAKFSSMTKKELLECKTRLSVASYQDFYETTLNPVLVSQYEVNGCKGLLLSKNSRCLDEESLQVCTSCKTSLQSNYKSPPKYANHVLSFIVRSCLTNWWLHSYHCLQVGYCQRLCHRPGARQDKGSKAERRNCGSRDARVRLH